MDDPFSPDEWAELANLLNEAAARDDRLMRLRAKIRRIAAQRARLAGTANGLGLPGVLKIIGNGGEKRV